VAAELLRSELVDPIRFKNLMVNYGGQFIPGKSNSLRHVYFSRRLNRWFSVSSESGAVRVNHYTDCPCTLSK
jgi:hypothetical protein